MITTTVSPQIATLVEQYMLETLARLEIPAHQLDFDINLLELGLESHTIVHLSEMLEQELQIELYPTIFFEYPTLRAIIDYFSETFPHSFVAYYQQPPPALAEVSEPAAVQRPATPTALAHPPYQWGYYSLPATHWYTLAWSTTSLPLPTAASQPTTKRAVILLNQPDSRIKEFTLQRDLGAITLATPAQFDPVGLPLVVYIIDKESEQPTDTLLACYQLFQAIARAMRAQRAYRPSVLVLLDTADAQQSPLLFALRSLVRAIHSEYPVWQALLVGGEVFQQEGLLRLAAAADGGLAAGCYHWQQGQLTELVSRAVSLNAAPPSTLRLPTPRTILVSGGSGKIGQILAAYLADKFPCRLVLLGRSEQPAEIRGLQQAVRHPESTIMYRRLDVADRQAVLGLVADLKQQYGAIHGVLHAAGVLRDGSFFEKPAADVLAVTAAKVDGLRWLDEATADEPLDFFVGFSSVSSFIGNRGQTDYSMANGWLDGYLRRRATQVPAGQRQGRSLAINWPLWAEGGMRPPSAMIELMEKTLGLHVLPTLDACQAFEMAVAATDYAQLCLVRGDRSRFEDQLNLLAPPSSLALAAPIAPPLPASPVAFAPLLPPPAPAALKPMPRVEVLLPAPEAPPAPWAGPQKPAALAGPTVAPDDIAIIGMAGRYPGADSLAAFWQNLLNGTEHVGPFSAQRLEKWQLVKGFFAEENWEQLIQGGFLDRVDLFDADFFSISPREAELMDPQQRLFLEQCWRCIEDAGYDPKQLAGTKLGVFAGVSTRDYLELLMCYQTTIEPQHSTGVAACVLANRVSYVLNVNGPSEIVDTACSSSLVALNRAVAALHRGECDQALVGGVNLILSPIATVAFLRTGILSPDGHCKTFDKDANGYVRGEGVGAILLKPLAKALADHDHIEAVIKGVAVNHNGHGQSLTAPNPVKQAEVIVEAMQRAGVDPATISYVEAHGTGTALGDPVEVTGLKKAFRAARLSASPHPLPANFCGLGSVKSNIGHLEAAAGIAGLSKAVLMLKNGVIPASLNITEVSPFINLAESPFYIAQQTQLWPESSAPRRAGVSCFGFGGTNAHAILEEFRAVATPVSTQAQLLPFSAPTPEQLQDYVQAMVAQLRQQPGLSLADVAFTLQVGRTPLPARCFFVASTVQQLLEQLTSFTATPTPAAPVMKALRKILATEAGAYFLRDLAQKGELATIGTLWQEGLEINWLALYEPTAAARRLSLPSFPFRQQAFWATPGQFFNLPGGPAAPPVTALVGPEVSETPPAGKAELAAFIRQEVAELLRRGVTDIDPATNLLTYGLDSILGMSLVKALERRLGIPVYATELVQNETIQKLTDYLWHEAHLATAKGAATGVSDTGPVLGTPVAAAPLAVPLVFLLSTPRAGSTLLRAMLAGHPQLFAPPELHLLSFQTMLERQRQIGSSGFDEGLLEAVQHLRGWGLEEAKAWIDEQIQAQTPTQAVYAALQNWAEGRLVVDKSPSYAGSAATLQAIPAMFTSARSIFLVRHPLAVMESIVRNRFHRFVSGADEGEDSYAIGERIWQEFNQHIVDFVASQPADQSKLVYYEDLVANPTAIVTDICQFLGVSFQEGMLVPYEAGRMIHGLHEHSKSIGDPNFLQHQTIDATLADAWRARLAEPPVLADATLRLAAQLGYDLGQPLPISGQQAVALEQNGATWSLAHQFSFATKRSLTQAAVQAVVDGLLAANALLHRTLDLSTGQWTVATDIASLGRADYQFLPKSQQADPYLFWQQQLEQARQVIDPTRGPILCLSIVSTGKKNYTGLLVYSHLVGDGYTSAHLIRQLVTALDTGTVPPSPVADSYLRWLATTPVPAVNDLKLVGAEGTMLADFRNQVPLAASRVEYSDHWTADSLPPGSLFVTLGMGLARTLAAYSAPTAPATLLLAVRHHGRWQEGQPFGKQVGLLAYDVPVLLAMGQPALDFLAAYHEALATTNSATRSNAQVRFNYQPHLTVGDGVPFTLNQSSEFLPPATPLVYGLDCIAREQPDGGLHLLVRYSDQQFKADTIAALVQQWKHTVSVAQPIAQ